LCIVQAWHVQANVNTPEENQNNQNSSRNEVKDLMLKGHPLPQISATDESALVSMCEKDEKL
jgi:hypothetical protein